MTPRGASALIAMRKSGTVPAGEVWITIGDGQEPDWWQWSNTYQTPQILVRPADPVERLDLRCIVGLKTLFFFASWDDRVARIYERLQEYAEEIAVMSPAFDTDIGWRWIKRYGRVEFGETHYIEDLKRAQGDRTTASRRDDKPAYQAAQANEMRILEAAPWLR